MGPKSTTVRDQMMKSRNPMTTWAVKCFYEWSQCAVLRWPWGKINVMCFSKTNTCNVIKLYFANSLGHTFSSGFIYHIHVFTFKFCNFRIRQFHGPLIFFNCLVYIQSFSLVYFYFQCNKDRDRILTCSLFWRTYQFDGLPSLLILL